VTCWIRTPAALAELAESLRGARAVALDSEADSLYHHFEKVCLVQLAGPDGRGVLIDPLEARDLGALAPVVADPGVVKVFHGADYDVTSMKRDFGFVFAGLFDTMIASRYLGFPEIGLQAVARRELGVELSKSSQKDDWSRRPLTPAQEAYALADVQHLLALHERLAAQLEAKGRLAWVLEECEAVAALPAARHHRDPDAWQRIKGVRRLKPRGLAVARALDAWREDFAERTDRPPFRILTNDVLLEIAAAPPASPAELGRLRALMPRLRDEAGAIWDALQRAAAVPEAELPRLPVGARPEVAPEARRRNDALKAWRLEKAKALELDVSVVLPQRLIDRLAEAAPRDRGGLEAIEGLRRWRIAEFGGELLRVLR
jgi:ribonuclease D